MTRGLRLRWLVVVALAVATLGWVLLDQARGRGTMLSPVRWPVHVGLLLLCVGVVVAGLQVRSYLRGRRPSFDGLRAARTLVLAQAAALTGAGLTGWYAAQVLLVVGDLGFEPMRDRAIGAVAAALLSVVLTVAGCVVERWCRIASPHDDVDGPGGRGAEPDGQPA